MRYFQSKYTELPGTSLPEVIKHARREYHAIQKRSPRRVAYVRAKYFRQKIFINTFWAHLDTKKYQDCMRRLKLFNCAIDLLRGSNLPPIIKQTPNQTNEICYRFYGISKNGKKFCVQIKENKRTGRKDFMSVFPVKPK